MFERFSLPIDYRREEFTLDFTSSFSDKSTSDNIVSDEDHSCTRKLNKHNLKPLDLEYEKSR